MYFGNYRLRNTSLDKCLKGPFSEDVLTGYIVNEPRHY